MSATARDGADADDVVLSGDDLFIAELGLQREVVGERIVGEMDVTPELLVPGHRVPRVSVLATVGDVMVRQLASQITPTVPLTTDLSIHLLGPMATGRFRVDGRLVKVGRTLLAGETSWYDAGGNVVAYCWVTFMASHWANETLCGFQRSDDDDELPDRPRVTMSKPFTEALGIRTVDEGVTEVERRPYVLQPTGTLQGGVVCALGEVAAELVLGRPVVSMDTHYLAGIRVGAGRATASALGAEMARVEVVDTGRPERVAAVMRARGAPIRS